MSSKVKFVGNEAFEIRDSKTLVDRVLDGPNVYQRTATDTRGKSHEASGPDPETAADKAIFGILKNRRND